MVTFRLLARAGRLHTPHPQKAPFANGIPVYASGNTGDRRGIPTSCTGQRPAGHFAPRLATRIFWNIGRAGYFFRLDEFRIAAGRIRLAGHSPQKMRTQLTPLASDQFRSFNFMGLSTIQNVWGRGFHGLADLTQSLRTWAWRS